MKRAAVYVETSALLRILLEGDRTLAQTVGAYPKLVTSALTFVEAERSLGRASRERRIADASSGERWLHAFERSCDVMLLGEEVTERARRPFPVEPIRSLDALHLASILLWDRAVAGLVIASCNERVRRNGEALGFQLIPGE